MNRILRENSDKRVHWTLSELLQYDDYERVCLKLTRRQIQSLLSLFPAMKWETRWYKGGEDFDHDKFASQLLYDILQFYDCDDSVNDEKCNECEDDMCGCGKLVRLNGSWYVTSCTDLIPFDQTSQEYSQSELVPNAASNGYVVNSDDFVGSQFGGQSAFLGLSDCEASTAFVDYLLESTRNMVQSLINQIQVNSGIITAEFLLNILEDVPVLGSIGDEILSEIIAFPENVLLDAEGILDNVEYRYVVQRAMYGLIANEDVILSRGLLQTWAHNTPFVFGATNTPMQAILTLAMSGVDMAKVQRIGSTFVGNGDPELCVQFENDTNKYPAGSNFTGAGATPIAGYYALPTVRYDLTDEEMTSNPQSFGTYFNSAVPAGAVAGILINIVSMEHTGNDGNPSGWRIVLFDSTNTNRANTPICVSFVGSADNSTLTQTQPDRIDAFNQRILLTETQTIANAFPDAVTDVRDGVGSALTDLLSESMDRIDMNAFKISWAQGDNLNVTFDLTVYIDEAVLPQS